MRKLARLTGIGEDKLDQYEMGRNAITLEMLSHLAAALGLPMKALLMAVV